MIEDVVTTVAFLGGVGLVLSGLIVVFDRFFGSKTPNDSLISAVNDLLPQTQCAQCGYPGCLPYAESVIDGESISLCVPGGEEVQEKLSDLLDRTKEGVQLADPSTQLARIRERECIGCGLCSMACPVDAIVGAEQFLHTILEQNCTGCELCVPTCPVDCIDMIDPPTETLSTVENTNNLPPMDWRSASPQSLLERIEHAQIIGMGGAGYPAHKKIKAAIGTDARILIANGVETDPGVTADWALLSQHGDEVLEGMQIVSRILGASSCYLAVSDPQLASNLVDRSDSELSVQVIENSYQNGEERVLIQKLIGTTIPKDQYPTQHGIVVFNVATLFAICECVRDGIQPFRRMLTVLGEDQWHSLGTPIQTIVNSPLPLRTGSAANGHPAQQSDGIQATHNAISFDLAESAQSCIRCGWCTDACPLGLPVDQFFEDATERNSVSRQAGQLNECNDCGACVEACPSGIRLLDYIRDSRASNNERLSKSEYATQARIRFEAKQERLLKDSQHAHRERDLRMQQDHQWL